MSRNMTEANRIAFGRLEGLVASDVVRLSESKKYIKTSDCEKEWLKPVRFYKNEDLFIDQHRFFALAIFRDERYVLQIGFGPIFDGGDDLLLQENNSGLFTALISDLKIPLLDRANVDLDLCNEVFLPSKSSEKIGFERADLEKYFVGYSCYLVDKNSTLFDQEDELLLQKVALYVLGNSPEIVYLSIPPSALDHIKNLARLDVKTLPFDRVFRAFIERRYEHAFLDLYRCLEMLFSLKKIDLLRSRLKLNSMHLEISADVEDALGWRPTEKNALNEMLNDFPNGLKELLKNCFNNNSEIGVNIYGLRNECVHFRPLQKKSTLHKQVDWPKLLEGMVLLINHAYSVSYRSMF